MTLELRKPVVNGTYFFFDELKEIAVHGKLGDDSALLLDVADLPSGTGSRLEGRFPDRDAERNNTLLQCDLILGNLIESVSGQKLPVKLRMTDIIAADLANRYSPAGATDDELVERNALRFGMRSSRMIGRQYP